jgi:isoquinoline 1-oxidoreductase beta subunit
MNATLRAIGRREFLKLFGVAGTGLVIGIRLGAGEALAAESTAAGFAPNAFLRIDANGSVTIWVTRSELGQGPRTALPMLVAEELEADWRRVRIEPAILDRKYGNQGTGGSMSVRESWIPLRKAGAAAREMLIAAAAAAWAVPPSACHARAGEVIHAKSGRRLAYGALVKRAARLPVPADPPLKEPKDFRILGTPVARLDTPSKVDGSARFGLDMKVPGMLFAAVARSPVFGGSPASVDDTRARQVPGVRDVVRFGTRVAVVADGTWAAFEGLRALQVTWDEGANASLDGAGIRRTLEEAAQRKGAVARNDGDAEAGIGRAASKLEADYEVPFAAHAPMEPMNCVADVRGDRCEVWAPTQFPSIVRGAVAGQIEIPPEAVRVNITLAGGAFGRRIEPDYAVEAAAVSKRVGAPVQVVWSREDDFHHDWFRPASLHRLSAGVEGGRVMAWTHRVVTPSIMAQRDPGAVKNGYDEGTTDAAANIPYAIPGIHVESVLVETAVPIGWWRSVYASQNAFATECFLDEVAVALERDPLELRRELLAKSPRHLGVVELAAAKANWGSPLPTGRGRGIALCESFGSYVAEVAEVSVGPNGEPRVHRVVCAVDCGLIVNPSLIAQQLEGAVAFALTAALRGPVAIEKGRVQQSNFNDYDPIRMSEMPEVEVHIVPSHESPGGIGEPGVPPLAPAVANALFAATGRRVRRLPIRAEDLRKQ